MCLRHVLEPYAGVCTWAHECCYVDSCNQRAEEGWLPHRFNFDVDLALTFAAGYSMGVPAQLLSAHGK